MKFATKKLA